MKIHKKILILITALVVSFSNIAYSETFYGVGDSTTGTYADYMKTVYNRAGMPELLALPLTTFENTDNKGITIFPYLNIIKLSCWK